MALRSSHCWDVSKIGQPGVAGFTSKLLQPTRINKFDAKNQMTSTDAFARIGCSCPGRTHDTAALHHVLRCCVEPRLLCRHRVPCGSPVTQQAQKSWGQQREAPGSDRHLRRHGQESQGRRHHSETSSGRRRANPDFLPGTSAVSCSLRWLKGMSWMLAHCQLMHVQRDVLHVLDGVRLLQPEPLFSRSTCQTLLKSRRNIKQDDRASLATLEGARKHRGSFLHER